MSARVERADVEPDAVESDGARPARHREAGEDDGREDLDPVGDRISVRARTFYAKSSLHDARGRAVAHPLADGGKRGCDLGSRVGEVPRRHRARVARVSKLARERLAGVIHRQRAELLGVEAP